MDDDKTQQPSATGGPATPPVTDDSAQVPPSAGDSPVVTPADTPQVGGDQPVEVPPVKPEEKTEEGGSEQGSGGPAVPPGQ